MKQPNNTDINNTDILKHMNLHVCVTIQVTIANAKKRVVSMYGTKGFKDS